MTAPEPSCPQWIHLKIEVKFVFTAYSGRTPDCESPEDELTHDHALRSQYHGHFSVAGSVSMETSKQRAIIRVQNRARESRV